MSTSEKKYGTLIDRTMKIIRQNYLHTFKAIGVDITTEQWVMIDYLAKNNGVSQSELANSSFKNAPTVSRIIDLLEKKKYVKRERFENDRRRYKIFLTDEGMAIFEKAQPEVQQLRTKGWEGLSEDFFSNHISHLSLRVFCK